MAPSRAAGLPFAAALLGFAAGCGDRAAPAVVPAPPAVAAAPVPPPAVSPIRFVEVAAEYGIDFKHVSGLSREHYYPSANGSGVAIADFDLDGRMDLLFATTRQLTFVPGSPGPAPALYRNRIGQKFTEVAGPAGLPNGDFTHGACAADFDNDGFPDLAFARYGGTRLWMNNGDGTFTGSAGIADQGWGTSLCPLDADEDGQLDLYVTHYGHWSVAINEKCAPTGVPRYCSPTDIPPAAHALFRNAGGGAWQDRYAAWGLKRDDGRGMGCTACDLDGDGHVDLWVANDQCPNFVFMGSGNGPFHDATDHCGAARCARGVTMAGMGAEAGDVDRDGRPDLFVTNFKDEHNALYINQGRGLFDDASASANLIVGSRDTVNWGARLADFDHDGWLDILTLTGHVNDKIAETEPGASYRTPAKLWRNLGGAKPANARVRFEQIPSAAAGDCVAAPRCARGAGFGDFDNDGWLDVAVNGVDEPASVWRNVSALPANGRPPPWVRVRLIGRRSTRDPIGAKVTLKGKGLPHGEIVEWAKGGGSIMSSHDPRLLLGTGGAAVETLTVLWPSGAVSTVPSPAGGSELLMLEPLDGPAREAAR